MKDRKFSKKNRISIIVMQIKFVKKGTQKHMRSHFSQPDETKMYTKCNFSLNKSDYSYEKRDLVVRIIIIKDINHHMLFHFRPNHDT